MTDTIDIRKTKKRKNARDYIYIDGVKIDGDILLHVDEPMQDRSMFFRLLIAICATFSTIFLGLSYFDTGANNSIAALSVVIICLSFAAIRSDEGFIKLLGVLVIGMHLLTLGLMYHRIANGFILIYSKYLLKANKPDSVIEGLAKSVPISERDTDINLVVILIVMLVGFGMIFSCFYKINLPAMVIYSFPLFEVGAYWGWKPNTLCFVMLLICWTMIFALQLVNYSANKAGRKNTFAIHPRKRTFYFTSDRLKRGFFTKYIKSLLIVFVCIVLLLFIAVSAIGKDRPDRLLQARRDLAAYIEDMSYRTLTNTLSDLNDSIFGRTNIGGTNGGQLGRVDRISFNGSTALELVIEDFSFPVYLKGYVAGDYKDNSWEEHDPGDRLDDYADNNENYIQDIGFNKIENIAKFEDFQYSPSEFSVNIKGASKKYAYAPYFTSYASDENEGGDRCKPTTEGYVGLRARKYLMKYYNISKNPMVLVDDNAEINTALLMLATNVRTHSFYETQPEFDYYEYVIDNYLDVTETDGLEQAYKDINTNYIGIDGYQAEYSEGYADYVSYFNIVNSIVTYFDDNFEYTLTPGKTPSDEDFIDYFLTTQKKGYCSYYASAGVMLLRKYGIPARYVEGYIVHPNQLDEHNENGMNEIDVLDRNAHAWAEIYIRELGWIPIEFTPGYDEDNPNIDEEKNKEKNKNKDDSSNETTTTTTTTTTTSKENVTTKASTTTAKGTGSTSKAKTTTTTKKVISGTVESGDKKGGGGVFGGFFGDGGSGGNISIVYIYIAVIIIIIAVILARRAYNLRKLRNSLDSKNSQKAVINCYKAALKYLKLTGIKEVDNQSDSIAYKKIIKKMDKTGYDESTRESFKYLTDSAISSYFGKDDPDENVTSRCKAALDKIKRETSRLLNPVEKLGAMIIANLY
ncbi:MAG: transglutaminase domain-containing protein [Ruminococcus sp.]|nr:transglutaminase domain-containing protein [Ruminococcus sp.]